ncbi:MAG TPA: ATP-binding protein [Clostridia bacterium]|nr:ATP-binding protein [Clostridia bacterium]
MYRTAIELLYKWKDKKSRKPLIIRGARQVGKTWLMKEFGAKAYKKCVYISFDNNQRMQELFAADLNIERIVTGLELYAGYKIDPSETLLVFDEIQEVPKALTSLKYFNENAPQYHIVCAGSLLGVALHQGTSFPVGKVEFIDLFPLSFQEFMLAMGKEQYIKLLDGSDYSMVNTFRQEYIDLLKQYYYVGGMPEVVYNFSANKDFSEAREIQGGILDAYEQDFSKHAPHDVVPRIRMLWNSIPSQLTKENKKFIYGLIKEGARAKEYEMALLWLTDCGLVHMVNRVTAPSLPLKAYEDLKAFKLFLLDVGLLSCMVRLRQDVLLDGNELFKEFKGALTEQYVLQQLKTLKNINTYYWTNDRNSAEVDFLIDNGEDVIPLEVKAEVNLQAKSLKTFREKFNPKISLRTSMADYKKEDWLINFPLYAIGTIGKA